jgi:6-pyruvoyltetrahydropterin/6-carboxytetrahydropterin synthase
MFFVTKAFSFDAAHFIEDYDGKCQNLHGHSFVVKVTIRGDKLINGMLIDFNEIKTIADREVIAKLDHKYLNEVLEFNPTAELISAFIFTKINAELATINPKLVLDSVEVSESPNNTATYRRYS